MTIAVTIGLIIASIAALLGVMATVRSAGRRHGWSPEVQRKLVHVATGLFALALPVLFHERWPVVALLLVGIAVMMVLRVWAPARDRLGAAMHSVDRTSYGEIFLAIAVGFLFVRGLDQPILYVLPIAVLTLADAAAALVGSHYGRQRFAVEDGTKSWEGVVAFFLVAWILAMILLLLMTDVPRASVVLLSVIVAAFAAVVETDSWWGLDNLFIPVALHFFLQVHLGTSVSGLLVLAGGFLAAFASVAAIARHLRMKRNEVRAHTILIFLIMAVTEPQNGILPVMTVLTHLALCLRMPCSSTRSSLDLLAVMTAVALVWLILGEQAGLVAINLFNLTFAGAVVLMLTLLAQRRPMLSAAVPAAVACMVLGVELIAQVNSASSRWHGPLWPLSMASFALAAGLALIRPSWFGHHRAVRIFAAALVIPLSAFGYGVLVR